MCHPLQSNIVGMTIWVQGMMLVLCEYPFDILVNIIFTLVIACPMAPIISIYPAIPKWPSDGFIEFTRVVRVVVVEVVGVN